VLFVKQGFRTCLSTMPRMREVTLDQITCVCVLAY